MSTVESTIVGRLLHPATSGGVSPEGLARLEALNGQLAAVGAVLGSHPFDAHPGALDEAAWRLHSIEALLEVLAADEGVTTLSARRWRALREGVSVHLSAAATLRLLDLDANAAVVLARAVATVRAGLEGLRHPNTSVPVHEDG